MLLPGCDAGPQESGHGEREDENDGSGFPVHGSRGAKSWCYSAGAIRDRQWQGDKVPE